VITADTELPFYHPVPGEKASKEVYSNSIQ
jgi:hypothetical protein